LGFQPFLELFTWKQANIVLYTNYVALPLLHRKRKVALVVYDLSFLDHPEFTQGVNLKFLKRFCPPSIRKADLIITISEFTKQRLAYHFPELKSPVIVTPIPPVAQTLGGHLPQNLTGKGIKDNKYVLYIGTIEPRKNLQTLLRAWEIMSEELNSEYSLVLAGGKGWKDEAIRADIETLRTKGLRIVLPGYITDDEKCALYSNASCFVLPSHYEGFGMPILEAMQYGVPVAASDIPVFHEVASEAAIYFNKDNPEDIASKLLVLLKDDDLKTKLVAAGASRLRQFSWEKNAQLVANALDRLT
jgi:alpha-1,3-rhamnosyl/mannosyltransferase